MTAKNYENSLTGRSIVEGTTKFISVNASSFLNKKFKSISNISSIVLPKNSSIDGNNKNDKSDVTTSGESHLNQEMAALKHCSQPFSAKTSLPSLAFANLSSVQQQSSTLKIQNARQSNGMFTIKKTFCEFL